ncbi:MAG: hypothetical protein QW622_00830, partial [Candidatus Pacearchaeota archaeon]
MNKKGVSFVLISIVLLVLIFIIILLVLNEPEITGLTILLNKTSYAENETIGGIYELSLREGELLPFDTLFLISLGSQSKNMLLREWLDLSTVDYPLGYGTFYLENSTLAGSGDGLGKAGKRIEKPTISFKIRTFEITNQTQTNETTNETNQSEIPAINESMPIKSINGFSIFYPINPLSFIYFISALKTLIGFAIVEEMEVSVNADMPFVYEIPPGYDAEIVENSININGTPVSIELLQISKQDNILTISTNYTIIREGFGEEFLG